MGSKRRRWGFGLLFVLGALAPAPSAQAEPHWFRGEAELTKGAPPLSIPASGEITLLIVGLREVRCQASGTEDLSNPAIGFGEDSIAKLELSRCRITHALCPETKNVEVVPLGLPWRSQLFAGTLEGDALEGAKLEVRCKAGHTLHLFEGSLQGPVADGSIELGGTLREAEPHREAIVNLLEHLKSKHGKITIH